MTASKHATAKRVGSGDGEHAYDSRRATAIPAIHVGRGKKLSAHIDGCLPLGARCASERRKRRCGSSVKLHAGLPVPVNEALEKLTRPCTPLPCSAPHRRLPSERGGPFKFQFFASNSMAVYTG